MGYQFELRCLKDALNDAAAGEGGLLLVGGRHGAGKTRLLTEFRDYVRASGGICVTIRIGESRRGDVPAWWDRLTASLAGSEHVQDAPTRARLPVDVVEALKAAGARAAVVVIEDLHLASASALTAIAELVEEVRNQHLLVIGTFRIPSPLLTSSLTEHGCDGEHNRFGTIFLHGWSVNEMREYARAMLEGHASPKIVSMIHAISGGNPGYVVDLLRSLEGVPIDVDDAEWLDHLHPPIQRRLQSLSAKCEELVRFSALIPGKLDLGLLAVIFPEHDLHRLVGLVDEALGANVITETDEVGSYGFAHEAVRTAILNTMSSTRRAHLHSIVAELLYVHYQSTGGVSPAALSYHFRQAAGLSLRYASQALEFTLVAARAAEDRLDWREATEHYQAALSLLGRVGEENQRGSILLHLARSLRNSGARRSAWRIARQSIDWSRTHGSLEGIVRGTLIAATVPAPPQRHARLIREALSDLPAREKQNRSELFIQLALTDGVGTEEGRAAIAHASRLIPRHGHQPPRFMFAKAVVELRHHIEQGIHDELLPSRLEAIHRDLNAQGHIEDAFDALGFAGRYEAWWGELTNAGRYAQDLIDYRKRVALPVGRGHPEVLTATLLWMRGDMAGFRDMLGRIEPFILDSQLFPMQLAEYEGDLELARALMPDPAIAGKVSTMLGFVLGSRARLWMHLGDAGRARAELERWLTAVEQLSPTERGVRYAGLADVITTVAPQTTVQRAYKEAMASRLRWDRSLGVTADRGRGDLAFGLGRYDEAEMHYQQSLAWCQLQQAPVEEAWAHLGLARIGRVRQYPLTVSPHLDRAEELFRVYGAALGQEAVRAERERSDGLACFADGTLTQRELEVLRLLAQGRTNEEIAQALVISRNTVANHVSHILMKTGARNRTAAAAIGIQLGL